MTRALPVPQEDFTPFLLRQAGLRASLLKTSFGLAADDWEDLRQDLALDCLRRLPRFDATRGNWKGFVHGVVRNHACVLASRQARCPEYRPLEIDADGAHPDGGSARGTHDALTEDLRSTLDLRLDTQRVLDSLPKELQVIARYLAEMSFSAVSRRTGLTHTELTRKVGRIRAAFLVAGITPGSSITNRGSR